MTVHKVSPHFPFSYLFLRVLFFFSLTLPQKLKSLDIGEAKYSNNAILALKVQVIVGFCR